MKTSEFPCYELKCESKDCTECENFGEVLEIMCEMTDEEKKQMDEYFRWYLGE